MRRTSRETWAATLLLICLALILLLIYLFRGESRGMSAAEDFESTIPDPIESVAKPKMGEDSIAANPARRKSKTKTRRAVTEPDRPSPLDRKVEEL